MKKKKFVLVSIVVLVLVIAAIIIFGNTGAKPITYTYNPQDTTSHSNSNDYNLYLKEIEKICHEKDIVFIPENTSDCAFEAGCLQVRKDE